MSKHVDQRVVEMRFDNEQFEKNVKTSMSTLDKLKAALKFDGAEKGLDKISSSAKKFDMSGVSNAAESVRVKFSAMQVAGVTALANITNSAVNAGKHLVKSLTIDNVASGWNKLQQKANSMSTLISQGFSTETVENQLEKLNWFSDETSYNFTDMIDNISKFTATGQKLDDSVTAMQGIALWAAKSGQNAQKASGAMYQLSQALGSGVMRKEDWKSIQNASMDTDEFRQIALDTAVSMKKLKKTGTDTYVSLMATTKKGAESFKKSQFADSLTEGRWFDTDVMMEIYKKYSTGADQVKNILDVMSDKYHNDSLYAGDIIKAYESYQNGTLDSFMKSNGISGAAAKEMATMVSQLDKFGMSALKAGQEYRTFGDVIDATKDAVSTKMMGIFETILGNVDEQKKLWTAIGDKLYEWLVEPLTSLQATLSRVMNMTPLDKIKDKLSAVMKPAKQASDAVGKVTKTLDDYNKVVDRVIRGDYGTWQARWDKLEKEGYDWATVQNMVNEKLGDSTRHATKFKLSTNDAAKAQEKATKVDTKRLSELAKLSDAELRALGLTEEQIKAIHDLRDMAKKLGMSVDDLINKSDDLTGRWLLFDSFKNIGKAIAKVFASIGQAWRDMFPSKEGAAEDGLFNALAGFHRLTSQMIISDETADKLTRTFRGVFAILDLLRTVAGFGLKVAFTVLSKVLGFVNVDILDITASVGDAIVAFRDWVKQNDTLVNVFEAVTNAIASVIKFVVRLVKALWEIPAVQNGVKKFASFMVDSFNKISDYLNNLFTGDTPQHILDGLANGLSGGAKKVFDVVKTLGNGIISTFKKIFRIESPSKVFFMLGGFIIAGLINGLIKNGMDPVSDAFGRILDGVIGLIQNINWGVIISGGLVAGFVFTTVKITKTITNLIDSIAAPLKGLGDLLSGLGDYYKGLKFKAIGDGILAVAKAIAILSGSVIALTLVDPKKLWDAVKVVGALAAIMTGMVIAISKLAGLGDIKKSNQLVKLMTAIAFSMLTLGITMKLLGSMSLEQAEVAIMVFASVVGILALLLAEIGLITLKKGTGPKTVEAMGDLLKKLATSMLLLAVVCKILGSMSWKQLGVAGTALGGLVAIISLLLLAANKAGGKSAKVLDALEGVIKAVTALSLVAILLGLMPVRFLARGIGAIATLGLIVVGLMWATKKIGGDGKNVVKNIIVVSEAIAILAGVAMLLGLFPLPALVKGIVAVTALGSIVVGLMWATKKIGGDGKNVTKNIVAVSGAIAVLAGMALLMSAVNQGKLAIAMLMITWLAGIVVGLMAATKLMQNSKNIMKNIISVSSCLIALGTMVSALSLLNMKNVAVSAGALTLLSGALALMMLAASKIDAKKAVPNILIMTGVITLLGGVIYLLGGMKIGDVLGICAGIAILMTTMTISLAIMSNMGTVSIGAIAAIAVLTLVVGGLAFIFKMMVGMDPNVAMSYALSLSAVLMAMTVSLAVLTLIGAAGPSAFIGIGALTALIAALTVIVVGLGALAEKFPQMETFIDKGLPIMGKLGEALGSFFGNIIAGFADAVLDIIPMIGTKFSEFWTNITPFIEGVKSLDTSILANIAILAGAILAMTAVDLLNSIASFLTGSSSLIDFGNELVRFAPSVVKFSQIMATMTDEELTALSKTSLAVKYLCQAADAVPKRGGLVAKITGENSLTDFAKELVAFAPSLKSYASKVSEITPAELDAIVLANKAVKGICEVANKVPKHGGWLQAVTGDNSLTSFAEELDAMGPSLVSYGKTVSEGFSKKNLEAVKISTEAIGAICKVANKVPKHGGWVQAITGDNSLTAFAKELDATAPALVRYATKLIDMPAGAMGPDGTIVKSSNSIADMCKAASKLPKDGGFLSVFTGKKKTLKDFTKDMADAAPNIVKYGQKLGKLSFMELLAMVTGTDVLVTIADRITKWPKSIYSDSITTFFSKVLPGIGTSIATFGKNVGDVNDWSSVNTAIDELSRLGDIAVKLKSTDGFGKLGITLAEFAGSGINNMLNLFEFSASDAEAKITKYLDDVRSTVIEHTENTGSDIATGTKNGLTSKASVDAVKDGFMKLINAPFDAISMTVYKAKFAKAGAEAAAGFANGISSANMLTSSQEAAARVAISAVNALKKSLDIHSPSRVMYGIGEFAGLGFVNAMYDYGNKAYEAGSNIANMAREGLNDSVSKIQNYIDGRIDGQLRIRPVLDLSDISAGTRRLNGMLGSRSLSVVGSIGKVQNGANRDLLTAIKSLGDNLGGSTGDTYNINGITYDDGSNVQSAVATLVRAARIERRR